MISHKVTVRLNHTDAAGLLFYGRLFELVQEAFEVGLESRGVSLRDLLNDGEFRLPVVHVEANYKVPVCVSDVLEVKLSLSAGIHSLRAYAEITNLDGQQVAAVTVIHAVVSQASGETMELPDTLLALTR